MAEHDDQGNLEHRHRVLQASDDRIRDHLSGVTDDEEVAKALIEDDLRGQARVCAPEQCGTGALAAGEFMTTLDILPRVGRISRDEPGVALAHLVPHLGGRRGRRHQLSSRAAMICSVSPSATTRSVAASVAP